MELASDAAENLEERAVAVATAGEVASAPGEPAPAPAEPAGRNSWLPAAVQRYGDGVALAAVAIVYCFWPNNLAPDRKWYGGADDVVFIVLLAHLARRVIRRSPALLDLPSVISRAIRRTFGLNA
jgi:hypothetical protein